VAHQQVAHQQVARLPEPVTARIETGKPLTAKASS
jgi:hypothetical protein